MTDSTACDSARKIRRGRSDPTTRDRLSSSSSLTPGTSKRMALQVLAGRAIEPKRRHRCCAGRRAQRNGFARLGRRAECALAAGSSGSRRCPAVESFGQPIVVGVVADVRQEGVAVAGTAGDLRATRATESAHGDVRSDRGGAHDRRSAQGPGPDAARGSHARARSRTEAAHDYAADRSEPHGANPAAACPARQFCRARRRACGGRRVRRGLVPRVDRERTSSGSGLPSARPTRR